MFENLNKVLAALVDTEEKDEEIEKNFSLKFSYSDLFIATNGFSADHLLGKGSAGQVYRGCLRSGTELAVKVLPDPFAMNGFHEELKVLSRFRHPNLVTLLGWGQCDEDSGPKFLIYELLQGGDVGRRLYRSRTSREMFPWQHRLCVALDAACGLSYMVNSEPKAFHRDIKPTNILLDAYGVAKLADFGLAGTTVHTGQRCLNVSDISGTPGYLCPQFLRTGEVTEQSELYSLGILFLELLINQLPASPGPNGTIAYPLLASVQPHSPGALQRALSCLDPSAGWLRPVADEFTFLSLRCIDANVAQRPSLAEIVTDLKRLCCCAGLRGGSTIPMAQAQPVAMQAPSMAQQAPMQMQAQEQPPDNIGFTLLQSLGLTQLISKCQQSQQPPVRRDASPRSSNLSKLGETSPLFWSLGPSLTNDDEQYKTAHVTQVIGVPGPAESRRLGPGPVFQSKESQRQKLARPGFFCVRCGSAYSPENDFCNKCGSRLPSSSQSQDASARSRTYLPDGMPAPSAPGNGPAGLASSRFKLCQVSISEIPLCKAPFDPPPLLDMGKRTSSLESIWDIADSFSEGFITGDLPDPVVLEGSMTVPVRHPSGDFASGKSHGGVQLFEL